jgi:hypothetical protein
MARTKTPRQQPYIESDKSRWCRNLRLYPASILKHGDGWNVKWRNDDGDKCDEYCATEAEARECAKIVDRRHEIISKLYEQEHQERLRKEGQGYGW